MLSRLVSVGVFLENCKQVYRLEGREDSWQVSMAAKLAKKATVPRLVYLVLVGVAPFVKLDLFDFMMIVNT